MSILEQVVEYYDTLFDRLFTQPFGQQIHEVLRRNQVRRQIEEAADAASQSLARFLVNQQLSEAEANTILAKLASLPDFLKHEDISNSRETPEKVVESLLNNLPCPTILEESERATVYRVALRIVVQVLLLIGPLLAEWQRLGFSSQFELLRQVSARLNQISDQLRSLSEAGNQAAGASQEAIDEHFELIYRDFLMQRFFSN